MQFYCAINVSMQIPDRPRNPGAANATCAYTMCNQVKAKCVALAKKNPKITTGNFFVFKMKNEKCWILIGPQDQFFKMKINGAVKTLYRMYRIQESRESAILNIFLNGLKKLNFMIQIL